MSSSDLGGEDGSHGLATHDRVQSILKTRRRWRSSERGEAVWPVNLEAALLEGLEQYTPPVCKDTVASRMQQLRESSQDHELAHLLFPSPKSIATNVSFNHLESL
ncbi:hypothetical protein FB451DRAFT_1288756, partial [Mycena latifolia]